MATDSTWTPELKAQVVEAYESRNPTPENTMNIVTEVAKEVGKTPHGVRMVLSAAGAYIKKTPASSTSSGNSNSDKPKRVSKQDSIDSLVELYESQGMIADMEIMNKLTGKAAIYFKESISEMLDLDSEEEED